jgi:hypothetical protein
MNIRCFKRKEVKKSKLVYISKKQFGYQTDAYMHCKYSKNQLDIIFICFDIGYPKVEESGVKVIYLKDRENLLTNSLFFSIYCFYYILKNRSKIFIQYFPGCYWFKRLFFWKEMMLDIRSVSISTNEKTNLKYDQRITRSAAYFNHITVITEGVRNHLNIPQIKASILPLGTNIYSSAKKDFSGALNLMYIGTFNNRNINQTIEGLAIFMIKNPNKSIKYYIVGDGSKQEVSNVKNLISENNLEGIVHLLGYKRHAEIKDLWDICQIGVSYVPISQGYNLQPPTKTFEYLGAGMAVIATKTHENMKIINDKIGVLIEDSPIMFCKGIERIILNRHFYNSDLIRESIENYSWELIVKKYFINLFVDQT